MHWIQKVVLVILVFISNICMYYWGRRDGFNRCQEFTIEYLLKVIKEREERDV